jgi:type I restriction enzyme R subunit
MPLLEGIFRTLGGSDEPIYVTDREDTVVAVVRGYGKNNLKPHDYLDAFATYIRTHQNELPALVVVTQRPRDLTRQALRELKAALDADGYSETALRSAWKDTTNQDIAASIIGFIRQRALGSPLIPYEERVNRALAKIKAMRPWKQPQIKWLDRIAEQFKKEIIVDQAALNDGIFRRDGGFVQIDKQMDGHLGEVITGLGDAIWDDTVA